MNQTRSVTHYDHFVIEKLYLKYKNSGSRPLWLYIADDYNGTSKIHTNVCISRVLFRISYGKFLGCKPKNDRKNVSKCTHLLTFL